VKALIVGCGRVGSALALELDRDGWEVVVIDEDEGSIELLETWRQGFVVGHALEPSVLEEAGIQDVDVLVAATDGDNTNAVLAQVAKLRYEVPAVAARIHDPARADFYGGRGIEIVSPVRAAIGALSRWVKETGGAS
jgi:trk system potassium uptake protein TrkA